MGIFSREKIIGGGKGTGGMYAACYRDPKTDARGPEIWFPWLDPVLIIGRNRSGKDTGIIVPNALMNSTAISTVFQDTRLEVAQSPPSIAANNGAPGLPMRSASWSITIPISRATG